MVRKDAFRQIIADSISKSWDHVIIRDLDMPLSVNKIIALTGHRRAGKTSVCQGLIKTLRKTVTADRLVYINMEDDRLFPVSLQDMDHLLAAYYEMYPANKDKTVYFFLDEIQEVPHWEKFVRRLYDTENCRIYITGSSSSLLSREIASGLRGRTITHEIFPLSFPEFLNFNGIDRGHSTRALAKINHAFQTYLRQGGFPELVFLPPDLHRRVIKEYVDLMLFRDIAERFSIRNTVLLRYLFKYLLQNVGNLLSVNKVYNDLRSRGLSVSKDSIYEFTGHFEETFAIFRVRKWSTSQRKQMINPDKIYCIDHAYKRNVTGDEDIGRILENVVFLNLRRKGIVPNYFISVQEVDFFAEKEFLVNVSLHLDDPKTRKREIEGLLSAMKFFRMKEGLIVTLDGKEDVVDGGKRVRIRPAAEWLLEG